MNFTKRIYIFFLLPFLALAVITFSCSSEDIMTVLSKDGERTVVKRVIDGDTFELEDGRRVRLLGIDTPEKFDNEKLRREVSSEKDRFTIMKLGQISSNYVTELCEGKEVILLPERNYETEDRYGRLLRYIYFPDGTHINAKIIEDGFGEVYEKYPVSKTEELRKLQRQAMEEKRGLWGDIEGLKNFY